MPGKKYKPDFVRAAFHRYAVGEEHEGEQRMFCPVCEDPLTSQSPSASMNADEGVWNCLKGNHGGNIYAMVQDLKRETGFNIRAEAMSGKHADPEFSAAAAERLAFSKGKSSAPLPSDEQVAAWSEKLLSNPTKLDALMSQRGFDRKTIIESEVGFDGDRYTIPIRDIAGQLLNVRRYKMGGDAKNKMLNIAGHGEAQIYRPDILASHDEIVITEGETDCILLNQFGIPAVTHTAGAATFRTAWAGQFTDKTVWVCYDNDDAGRKGAKKVQQILQAFAKNLYILEIPMTTKSADVTDYLHMEGHTASDFQGLMEASREANGASAKINAPLATAGKHISLNESMAQEHQAETLELTVSIAGKQQEPYTAPKLITVTCDQSKGAACNMCPIAAANGQAQIEMRTDDEQLFRFVDIGEQRRKTLLKEITGARCTDRSEFEVEENYHVEELLVQPSVDDRTDGETQQPVKRTAFSISTHSSPVNSKVRLVGRNVQDPKTGKLKFMSWVNEPVDMDIDKFELTDEVRDRLKQFQPAETESSLDKALEIARDMAVNVTHIYGRDMLHVGYDLVWHSPISFKVHDQVVEKGWLEMAVVGDTRTGKSEIASQMISHYRAGVLQSCEGMSFPGLVGGVQQIDGRWHMTWGVIPMNDRRLVVLDEVSGLKDKDVIEQMSSIRSSGVAQVTKIAAEETSARTRLIWMMNPADGSMLKDNARAGMGALRTVVPNAEDVARFDFVMATAKGDVESAVINSGFGEVHSPKYSSEDCEALVKWVWSLTRNDVVISEKAAEEAVKQALELGERYISDPPLIQSENVRFKLLRIAAALAARTFSVDRRGRLQVNREHVLDAVAFLDRAYDEEAMGYGRASRRAILNAERAEQKKALLMSYLEENDDTVLLTLRMVGANTFRVRDFVEFGSMDQVAAKLAVNQLLKWGAARLKSRGDVAMDKVLLDVMRALEDREEE